MIDFVVIRTETTMVHGILFGGAFYAMGVHGAVLWGVFDLCFLVYPLHQSYQRGRSRQILRLAPVRHVGDLCSHRNRLRPEPYDGEPNILLLWRAKVRDPGTARDPFNHILGLVSWHCGDGLCSPTDTPYPYSRAVQ